MLPVSAIHCINMLYTETSGLVSCASIKSSTESGQRTAGVGASTLANAQAVLEISCALNLFTRSVASLANEANSFSSRVPNVANAQAVLASPWVLKSLICCIASRPNAANSSSSKWPSVANAQAVLAMSCA
eukprot:gnl/TRDRNA2_/TRDRNA2_178054_c3_seq5.p1 gnl/TRDRNA2_/TRDRNA2_178054_c3~~gnl/TRDRNA2_/TRDRNA2_178054_c3_seq5.p1  ORF type:complete len:131 (-),score=9.82 gnl/TRDRNA2_/TRDRNA2_178054_c3_seq5:90-482(-)